MRSFEDWDAATTVVRGRAVRPICSRNEERTWTLLDHDTWRCEEGACEGDMNSCTAYRAFRDRIYEEDHEYARRNPDIVVCGPGPEAIPTWLRQASWVRWRDVRFSPPLLPKDLGPRKDDVMRPADPDVVRQTEFERCNHGTCDCEVWFCLCGDERLGTSMFLEENTPRCEVGYLARAVSERRVEVVGHEAGDGPVCVALGIDRRRSDLPGTGDRARDLQVVGIRRGERGYAPIRVTEYGTMVASVDRPSE